MNLPPAETSKEALDCAGDAVAPQITHNHIELDSLRCLLPDCSRDDYESYLKCLRRPPISHWGQSIFRRILDASIAAVVVVITAVPMVLIACAIRLTSPGPALFRQYRVGTGGRFFRVLKFRTMAVRKEQGSGLTPDGDIRITPLGRFLRKLKLDELPQFINVLRGEMSLVGPRPKMAKYAAISDMPYRPGITGIASVAFRFEDQILGSVAPERVEAFYSHHIKPLKANLDVCYMCKASAASDLRVITATAVSCIWPKWVPRVLGSDPEIPALTGLPPIRKEQISPGEN